MKVIDIIFALICGRVVGWIFVDFAKGFGIEMLWYQRYLFYIFLSFLSLFCLWIAYLLGKKFPFIFQAAKFFLIGAFSAVVDIKIFQLSAWLFSLTIVVSPLIPKAISFLVATFVKYWGNKHWAFENHQKENIKKEVLQFFAVTLIGLVLDVAAFYYFTKMMGPQFEIPVKVWTELSIVFAALAAAIWNFLGYKFLVFKK